MLSTLVLALLCLTRDTWVYYIERANNVALSYGTACVLLRSVLTVYSEGVSLALSCRSEARRQAAPRPRTQRQLSGLFPRTRHKGSPAIRIKSASCLSDIRVRT